MNRPTPQRVLVITAYAGEPQRRAAEAMIRAQVELASITQCHVEGFSMDGAMGEVHRLSHQAAGNIDWILKLDGDMVPANVDSVARLVRAAMRIGCDRFTTPVLDSITRSQILGVHLYRPEAVAQDRLVVQHRPDAWLSSIPGEEWRRVLNPQVLHAPDPDVQQSARFGVQRATKAVIDGKHSSHWSTLADVARAAATGVPEAKVALTAAWAALGRLPGTSPLGRDAVNRSSADFQGVLRSLQHDDWVGWAHRGGLLRPGAVWAHHQTLFGDLAATFRKRASTRVRRVRPWLRLPPRVL
jgi:hypothetical protein